VSMYNNDDDCKQYTFHITMSEACRGTAGSQGRIVHAKKCCSAQITNIQGFVSRVDHLLSTGVLVVGWNVSARCSSRCRRAGCSCRLTASTALITEA